MTERTKAEIQIAAEASLIGSVLAKREHMMYLGGITIDHFIDKAHARAWQRLLSDVTITDELSLQLTDNELSDAHRSEEHTSELQSLMRISYAVLCLKKKKHKQT